ncbi:MAG: AAA family ATPase [Pseudomonadales bacterium]|nr:AAA family ATPase [Pseudomonadales bacterium]
MTSTPTQKRKVDVYAGFLPELIIEKVSEGTLADTAGLEQFDCAVMFADISGFTPLAESFAAEGAKGAEKLTDTLNAYFSHLVGIIQTHGGDVVKFAGDAVLALWKDSGSAEDLAYASWRAAQCGLAIQEALKDYRAGNVSLSLRIAIGAGSVNIIHVGGVYSRWEFLVAGKPLEQVGTVSDSIEPGYVGVSAEAWKYMQAYTIANPEGEEIAPDILRLDKIANLDRRKNRPDIQLREEQASLLRPYLPAAVTHRLDANLDAYLGELRRLTILFVNLPDIDYQTPVETAQEIMIALQESCYKYEGSINKLSVDDKGVSLLAALGLPPLAHEDDPDRGIKAAITMNDRLKKLGIRSSIGVSSGRVYCGVVGSAERREYTIMGDSVNLAARLMQNAEDGVLCDKTSFSRAAGDVSFSEAKFIKLKGKVNLEEVYQVIDLNNNQQASAQSRSQMDAFPIIGRQQERDLLKTKLNNLLENSEESIVFIEAEAGYGKSRLKEDFIQSLENKSLSFIQASADAIDCSTPYFVVRELLFDCFGFDANTDVVEFRNAVTDLMKGSKNYNLLPLLSSIIPIEIDEVEFTLQLLGEVRATRTARIVVDIIKRSKKYKHMVMVIDDVHWLDSASWNVLMTMSREIGPLMLLLVTRPVPEPTKEMLTLQGRHNSSIIQMDRMPPEDIIRLVCSRLGVDNLPDPVSELILSRADGHPYFSEEMAYALRDNKIVEIKGGQCILKSEGDTLFSNVDIPESIEGVITSRIDRLSAAEALTIKVASVIGRSFSLNLLHKVHPVSQNIEVLRRELNECSRLQLTPEDTHGNDPGYIFKHKITQEVSYGLLLHDQSKQLHAQLAVLFEKQDSVSKQQYSLLAYHWERADQPLKALDCLVMAIDEAIDEYSNSDVLILSKRALNLIDAHGASDFTHGHILSCQGQALFELGFLDEGVEYLESAVRILGHVMPKHTIALVGSLLKEIFIQYRYVKNQLAGIKVKVPEDSTEQKMILEAAHAHAQIQLIYYYNSNVLRTLYSAVRGANLGCESGVVPRSLVRMNANLAMVGGLIPSRQMAAFYFALAEKQALILNHPPTTAWVNVVNGTYNNGVGKWQESENNFNQAFIVAEENADEALMAVIITARSKMQLMWGKYEASLAGFKSLYPAAIRRGDPQAICWSVLGQARNHFRLGKMEKLEALLSEAAPLLDGLPFNQRMDYLSLMALKSLHENDTVAAKAAVSHCVSLLDRPSQVMMIFACTQLATAILELKRREPSLSIKKWWKRTLRFIGSYEKIFPIGKPLYHYQKGQYEDLCGSKKLAIEEWQWALTSSLEIDIPYIFVMSINALRNTKQGVFMQYEKEYAEALDQLGVDEISR